MLWKKLTVLTAVGAALAAAAPAFADPPRWAPAHGWHVKHQHHRQHYYPDRHRVVVIQTRPCRYVPPRPLIVYRAPRYAAYAPVIPSHPEWGVRIGFRFGGEF